MAIFLIVPTGMEAELERAIQEKLPKKYYRLPRGEYVVSFSGTSKDLSDALGITDGRSGLGLVASIGGYHGRAPNDLWEWLAQAAKA